MEKNITKELLENNKKFLSCLIEKLSNNNKEVYNTLSFQKLDLDTFYNLILDLPDVLGYENIAILDNFMELFAISLQELEEKKDVFDKGIIEELKNSFIEINENLLIYLDRYYEELCNYTMYNELDYLPIIKHEKIKFNNYKTNPVIQETHKINEELYKGHISEIIAFIRNKVELAEQSQNKIFKDDNILITIHNNILNITFEGKNLKNVDLYKLIKKTDIEFHFKPYTGININIENCVITVLGFNCKKLKGRNFSYSPIGCPRVFDIKNKTFLHLSNNIIEDKDLTSYSVEEILFLQDEGFINPDSNFNGCKVNIDFINNIAKYNLNNLDISKISIEDLENLDLKHIQMSNVKISQEQFLKILNLEEGETFLGRTKGNFSGFDLSCIDLSDIGNLVEQIIVDENTSLENVQINRNIIETILNLPDNQTFLGRKKGDLHGFNLSYLNLTGLDFTNANLENTDLRGVSTNNATIFNNTNLNNTKIDNEDVKKIFTLGKNETYLGRNNGDIHNFIIPHRPCCWDIYIGSEDKKNMHISQINLRGIDINTGILIPDEFYVNAKIDEKQVQKVLNLGNIERYFATRVKGDLSQFDLSELNLRDFDFSNANLYRVNLSGTDLRRVNLLGTKYLNTIEFDENTVLTDAILSKTEIESILSNERNLGLKNIVVPCIMAYIKELGKNEEKLNKAEFIINNYKNKFEILEQDKVLDTTNSILNTENLDDAIIELENCFGIKSLNMQK